MAYFKDNYTPIEFYDNAEAIAKLGYDSTTRVLHTYQKNGEECSIGKGPAMTITNYGEGYWWRCYRCNEQGWVSNNNGMNPTATLNMLKEIGKELLKPDNNTTMSLPYDAVKFNESDKDNIPIEAWQWLWTHSIMQEDIDKYDFYWSEAYQRVIMPIKEYIIGETGSLGEKIVGWCGRCVMDLNKEERAEHKRPKYITKKIKDIDRIYFFAIGEEKDWCVIVEDILSAIRVTNATGVSSIALLSKSINEDLIQKLRGKGAIIWLDHDAKADAFKAMSKMNMSGVNAKLIATHLDPKKIPESHIKLLITRRMRNEKE